MMKNLKKIFFALAIAALLCTNSIDTFAYVSYPSVSQKGYLEMTASRRVNVYTNSACTRRGTSSPYKAYNAYIDAGDIIYVYSLTSSYCHFSYPTGAGRKLGYCKTADLLYLSSAVTTFISKGSCTVYRTPTGTSFGSVARYDRVYTIGKINNRGLIIYTAKSGNRAWKAGWINVSNVSKLKNGASSSSTTLSYGLYHKSSAYISCGFNGYVKTPGKHEGIDIQGGNGSAIYSLTDGVVVRVAKGYRGSSGLSTIAIYDAPSNKTVVYLHCAPTSLSPGQTIKKGQYLGVQDWRGVSSSSGGHTHVEVVNGRSGYAKKSVNDYRLENSNPTSYWSSKGYIIK